MIKQFEKTDVNHLLYEENQMVDALATLVATFQVKSSDEVQPIHMSIRETLAHYSHVEEEADKNSWYHDILC